jgi:methylated-DNA-[protein]-cysteine S-methyltransferase
MRLLAAQFPPDRVFWTVVQSPVGELAIGKTGKGEVCRIAFLCGNAVKDVIDRWASRWPKTEFRKDLKAVFCKDPDVLLVGSDFQQSVWRQIAAIPCGKTRTYGQLAKNIGKPKAVRAVGTACGANPVPFLIPCHRVVGANDLGGFSGGLGLKEKLLKSEAVLR